MKSNEKTQEAERGFWLAVLLLLVGFVHPFAFGSTPDVNRVGNSMHDLGQSHQVFNPLFQASNHRVSPQPIYAESSAVSKIEEPPRSRLRRLVSGFRKSDEHWKGGETTASLPSRMLFRYVSPLLDLAGRRTLTEDDAFELPDHRSMDQSVESLAIIYDEVRQKAQKRVEAQREMGDDKVKNSKSIILLKALLKQQRLTLCLTAVMRLVNTGVQAFPAILVSRLLKSIEAGQSVPFSRAFTAALALVSVLSLKMVVENQFFHKVVCMSTKTRGSLEGLIFDKALRLPDGGSGVMTKQRSKEEKKALGSGGVLNLLQTDASIIENAAMQIHTIWDGPLQVCHPILNVC